MEKEIQVAAKWWADQLRTKARQDNGDFMHNAMMAILTRQQQPIEKQKGDLFEAKLIELLTKERNERQSATNVNEYYRNGMSCLSVDYGADLTLRKAAEEAGVDIDMRLPVKTNMWIEQGKVSVSCGYRAPIEILYSEPT